MLSKTKTSIACDSSVFEDLGVPGAKIHALKAALVAQMQIVIESRSLTPQEVIAVARADLSRILRGQFRDTSLEELLAYLTRLGCDVDIVVKPANKKPFAPIHLEAEA